MVRSKEKIFYLERTVVLRVESTALVVLYQVMML